MIDWTAATCPISQHFTVRDALRLPSWGGRLAVPEDGLTPEIEAAIEMFATEYLEPIRALWAKPFIVHVWYRPPAYNLQIGGAKGSAHMEGIAVDFDVGTRQDNQNFIDWAKGTGQLDSIGLRCEDNGPLPGWIHLDCRQPGPGGRFFKP